MIINRIFQNFVFCLLYSFINHLMLRPITFILWPFEVGPDPYTLGNSELQLIKYFKLAPPQPATTVKSWLLIDASVTI